MGLRQSLAIKSIVHHKIKSSTHIRYIALEHFIRIHRNVQPVQIQTIIRLEQLADIRIFILLLLTGGKPNFSNLRKLAARGSVQHLGTMPANHRLTFGEKRSIYCCSTLIITFFFRHQIIILLTRLLSSRNHALPVPKPIRDPQSSQYVLYTIHVQYRV